MPVADIRGTKDHITRLNLDSALTFLLVVTDATNTDEVHGTMVMPCATGAWSKGDEVGLLELVLRVMVN